MKKYRRALGFTMVEVLVSVAVLLVGITVIVSSFSMQLRHSTQSRASLMANLVMESLVEEVLAHPYGDSPPASWSDPVSFLWVVEGRRVENKFSRKVEIAPKIGNGSAWGQNKGDIDVLRLEVSWTEASGVAASGEDKSISVDLTVAKEI